MKRYPGGSEWRKWDLHVHLPGTRLADRYTKLPSGIDDWDRFADALENSDVAVVGVTDYFSATRIFDFIAHFKARYPKSDKLLLPNVEFRLNETVNTAKELVHFHVIFRDDVVAAEVEEFLGALQTQVTVAGGKKLTCAGLTTKTHFETATISRDDLQKAFDLAFGPKTVASSKVIYLAPANNDGIRAMKGNKRKAALADEIDKMAHAFFGGSVNRDYFLDPNRYEGKKPKAVLKPVFSGCDAHSFDELEAWLGKDVDVKGTRQEITWIKADPTFEGLQQTLIEPADRVAIQPTMPDVKEPYKVIKAVRFSGSKDFPSEIVFNSNLNAIIGSRSSGKSALLAHISYSVDPDYTVRQQMMASHQKESDVGPAAGKSWKSVSKTTCTVEWADPGASTGNVIYIPQNWLYEISDNAAEVTAKIQPALESQYPKFFREHQRLIAVVAAANTDIERAVEDWFETSDQVDELEGELRKVGDPEAIAHARDEMKSEIDRVRIEYALSETDLVLYQDVVASISAKEDRIQEIDGEKADLAPYVADVSGKFVAEPGAVVVEIDTNPHADEVPESLAVEYQKSLGATTAELTTQLERLTVTYRTQIEAEQTRLAKERSKLELDHKDLIAKHEANEALDSLVKRHKEQLDALTLIAQLGKSRKKRLDDLKSIETRLAAQIKLRSATFTELETNFRAEVRTLDDLSFGIQAKVSEDALRAMSESFRKSELGTFIFKDGDDQVVDIAKAQSDPRGFLQDVRSGTQKLNQSYIKVDTCQEVLTSSPEVRFTAELEGDVIGGFDKSTMTPGKQALFALTLILNEAQDSWPLLIDQPEDDLDSRSIYKAIAPYLVQRKRERQIILVTHNANLVIGADAEEVLVANRHGDDSKNRNGQTFDYLTGSLEHSDVARSAYALEKMGMREHACDILDGGEEAFQKRAEKYQI